jgi:hypothetical protein
MMKKTTPAVTTKKQPPWGPREDFNQAASRIVEQATKEEKKPTKR